MQGRGGHAGPLNSGILIFNYFPPIIFSFSFLRYKMYAKVCGLAFFFFPSAFQ